MVHKNKRGLSRIEFYHKGEQLRTDLTKLTLRDFGIHSRGKKFKEDTGSQQPEGYYDELIKYFSNNIWNLLSEMMWNISDGNEYPSNYDELVIRREKQNNAIKACKKLFLEIQFCKNIMPVKASAFMPYISKIDHEISLLKGWRKSNPKIAKRITAAENRKINGGVKEEK